MEEQSVVIAQATSPTEISSVRDLLREYIAWVFTLNADADEAPTFHGIEAELASLPGIYAPPSGRLLLATQEGKPAGCVCLKPLGNATCEVKRLYVKPAMRGLSVGTLLISRLVDEARCEGFQRIILDSHQSMARAHAVYEAAGFQRIPALADFPEHLKTVVIFMECNLN